MSEGGPSQPGRVAQRLFRKAMLANLRMITEALLPLPAGSQILDVGCGDGVNASMYCPPQSIVAGLEIQLAALKPARERLAVVGADLDHPWPIADRSFDAVVSNQVFEHVRDTDLFLAESHRVLRLGGILVLSTENLASWHNIAALVAGWQPFSLAPVSQRRARVGNPRAAGLEPDGKPEEHVRVLAYRGLKELVQAHGFGPVAIRGAGYYPLPEAVGRLDPRHAAFLTVVTRSIAR